MVFRGVLSNWAALVVTLVVSIVLTPVMIRGLGDFYFGMWILTMSVIDQYGLLNMGVGTAMSRLVARFSGVDRRRALDQTLTTAMVFALTVGILIIALSVFLAAILPPFFGIEGRDAITFARLFLLLGTTTAVAFLERMFGGYLGGHQRFDICNLLAIVKEINRAVLFMGILWGGYGIIEIATAMLCLTTLSLYLHYRAVRFVDRELSIRWRHLSLSRLREMLGFGFYVFLATVGDQLRFRLDSFVIARWVALPLVVPYSIAARLLDYFKAVLVGLTGPLMPAMSHLDGQTRRLDLHRLFLNSTRATALLSALIGSLLIVDGKVLLRLWLGDDFIYLDTSYTVLWILAIGYIIALAQSSSISAIYAVGRQKPLALWTLGEGFVNLALSIYWAPRYGLVGVALGTVVPMLVIKFMVQPWYTLKVLQLPAHKYLLAFLRPLLVMGLFWGFCEISRPVPIQFMSFVITLLWQIAVFGLLVYFIGIEPSERQRLWQHIRRWPVTIRALRPAQTGE